MNYKIKEYREKIFPGHGGIKLCAEKFGVHHQQWYDWESGKKTPGARNQQKLATFFGISVAELRGEAVQYPAPIKKSAGEAGIEVDAKAEAIRCFRVAEMLTHLGLRLLAAESATVTATDLDALTARLQDIASFAETLETPELRLDRDA